MTANKATDLFLHIASACLPSITSFREYYQTLNDSLYYFFYRRIGKASLIQKTVCLNFFCLR